MQLYQRRKTLHFFGQYTSRDEKETSKFPGEERKNALKAFPGAKTNQLNHYVTPTLEEFDYDCAIIHVDINGILRSKGMSKLKDFPKKITQIGTICQRFNIGKLYVSPILTSAWTFFNVGQINEAIKEF